MLLQVFVFYCRHLYAIAGVCMLLQVYAKEDRSVEKLSSNVSDVTITVLDVNDNTPAFHGAPYAFAVNETDDVGYAVGQVGFSTDMGLLTK